MSLPKITFNWELNVGTILALLAHLASVVIFCAIGYSRFKSMEDRQVAQGVLLVEHGKKIGEMSHQLGVIATIVDERTERRTGRP